MKKFIAVILFVIVMFIFTGCGNLFVEEVIPGIGESTGFMDLTWGMSQDDVRQSVGFTRVKDENTLTMGILDNDFPYNALNNRLADENVFYFRFGSMAVPQAEFLFHGNKLYEIKVKAEARYIDENHFHMLVEEFNKTLGESNFETGHVFETYTTRTIGWPIESGHMLLTHHDWATDITTNSVTMTYSNNSLKRALGVN